MKKTLWMLGVAVAALTSCTQNEVLEVPESRMIQFDTFVGKPTRAVTNIMTTNNLQKFYVYGAKGPKTDAGEFTNEDQSLVFDATEVSRTKNGDTWGAFGYSPLKAWEMGKYYRFAGYSDGNSQIADNVSVAYFANQTVNLSNGSTSTGYENKWGLTFTGYESNGKDLVAAVPAERNTITNQGAQTAVHFAFEHLLAQVIFRFTYGSTSSTTSDINVRIKQFTMNAIKKSNCTVIYYDENNQKTYVQWDSQFLKTADVGAQEYPGTSNGEYTYFSGNKEMDGSANNNIVIDQHYVIPQKNELTVSFTTESFRKENNGEEIITNTTSYKNIPLTIAGHEYWKPGYIYRYEANLNPTEHIIYFTASVDAWVDDESRDQAITNSGTSTTEGD